jgi:hypothetical protein
MDKIELEVGEKGNDVMKAVGSLKEMSQDLRDATKDCDKYAEDVGHWLGILAKALLAIFK